ncbi:MAG: NAD(P)H-dependent glycerol-3-phosphate dehydrogenase [Cardiobacteriaceae bacterium]|nr:NAD(P)H-dependent glycerol-3-phosphate dehydrogenase [Cardiobacteriaceae bacterium]
MARLAVLGAGSWGTALALQLARQQHEIALWGHRDGHIEALRQNRENQRFLPGVPLPGNLHPTSDLAEAVAGAEMVLAVIPSHGFAGLLADLRPHLGDTPLMWAIKGFEAGTGRLLSEVFADVIGADHPHAMLAGPSFAREVAANMPTAVTIAAPDLEQAEWFARYFHGSAFLCYLSDDLIGAQIGGAVKNVIAIATGIADGIGAGANARAALVTRGLREITRLAIALGARPDTLTGLAGLGDLVLTATDDQSRNRRFGLALGRGQSADAAREQIAQVVEGEGAVFDTFVLAQKLGIRMPITEHLADMLSGKTGLRDTVASLMARTIKGERL